jgi:hypothetical protein
MFCYSRRIKTTRWPWAAASAKKGKCSFTILNLYTFSLQFTLLHAFLKWNTYLIFRIGNCVSVELLSPTVMSIVQVFHPLWCWVWIVSLWECCGLPSVKMWVGHGKDRWCGLSEECFGKIPDVRIGIVDCLERYLLVWHGIVVALERYPRYGVGWKGISFAESNARII